MYVFLCVRSSRATAARSHSDRREHERLCRPVRWLVVFNKKALLTFLVAYNCMNYKLPYAMRTRETLDACAHG